MSLLKKARKERREGWREERGRKGRKRERKETKEQGRKEYTREFTFILSSEPGKNVLAMKDKESEAQAGV